MMKIITALKIISCFSNWQIALKLWLRKRQTDAHPLRILRTRSGIKFFCREGTSDCNTVVEIFFLDEYRLAFDYLDNFFRKKTIVDLGANFGLFSLLCAHRYHDALIKAYEPAPPNCKQIKANISLNKNLKKRISLIPFVVGPNKGTARLAYNKSAPASANLYSSNHNYYDLQVISL